MAKVVAKVASVVAVVAKVGSYVALATGHPELAAALNTVSKVATVVAAVASAAAAVTAKRPAGTGGGSQTDFTADPNAGVPYAIGRTGTKGNIVRHSAADGWSKDTPNDLKDFVTVLSGAGPIASFESFTADKKAISFDQAGNAIGEFRDKMFQRVQRGLCPEPSALTVQAGTSAAPAGWTAAHKLSGLAATIWRLRYDAKQRFFQNGPPAPLWVIKGVLVYDPRRDSTYPGGSGPQRWNNEATWEWSENPYLHALTWCIGRHQNGRRVMGLGSPIDQIIVPDFVEGANVADANGWTIGGVIYSRPDTKWNVLKQMLQAGAGEPLRVGARVGCLVSTPRVSLATITAEDIIGDHQLAAMQPIRNRINIVTPRYRSEQHDWEIVAADPVRVDAYIPEDRGERSKEIEYTLVQNVDQAATLARYDLENTRELGPGTFPLKPKWLNYKAGDCLTIVLPDVPALKLMVAKREVDPATAVAAFTVRSETDAKHAFALGQTGTPPPTASIDYDYQKNGLYDGVVSGAIPFAIANSFPIGLSITAQMVEIAGANLLTSPNDLEASPWTLVGGITVAANAGAAPDGTATADKLVQQAVGAAGQYAFLAYGTPQTLTAGESYTQSIWLKGVAGGETVYLNLTPDGSTYVRQAVTLTTGWKQYFLTFTAPASGGWYPQFGTDRRDANQIATAAQAFYAWGAAFQAGQPSSAARIVISDHVRRYADGHADVAVTGATLTPDIQPGSFRAIYYDDPDRIGGTVAYGLTPDPLATPRVSPDHPGRHYVGFATIPTAGSPPVEGGGASPPGGNCVTVDTPILMADGSTKPAGSIVVGDKLWTRHQDRLSEMLGGWGVYPVEAIKIVPSDDVWEAVLGGRVLRATGDHTVYTGDWTAMRNIGRQVEPADVVKMTVTHAHTYVSNGVLSHNVKANAAE